MNEERVENYEHEKHDERKRKGAHLESIFAEHVVKKSSQANYDAEIQQGMTNQSNDSTSTSMHPYEEAELESSVDSLRMYAVNSEHLYDDDDDEEDVGEDVENDTQETSLAAAGNSPIAQHHDITPSGIARSYVERGRDAGFDNATRYPNQSTSRETERKTPVKGMEERGSEHNTFQMSAQSRLVDTTEHSKNSEFHGSIVVKQEKQEDTSPVQVIPLQNKKTHSLKDSGEIGEDCLKFLLFSGKLYHCERICDLTNSSRFIGDSVLGRKGKVVVLLLFHKTLREVLNYAVGVVDHYTLEENNIIVKVIKYHTYSTTNVTAKDAENTASKLGVGSKKLLYNLQSLNGPVYGELVKILDGFGANSAVDHAKISEFNAMVNANVDRLDGQISNVLGRPGYPYRGAFTNASFVSPNYTHHGSRYPLSTSRYSPLENQHIATSRYSPEKLHGGGFREMSSDMEPYDGGYQHRRNPHYYKERHHVNTVSANQTVRITPRTANSITDRPRAASTVPIAPKPRYTSLEEGSMTSAQRRNVEDLQTVAELCKEKMKRDMAEQELKSIKAAFEEFKSQMQKHLSQVEERMVLLEAENRTLKGKLSNMHQNNGFAEKKYHDLRSQLEELLKSS